MWLTNSSSFPWPSTLKLLSNIALNPEHHQDQNDSQDDKTDIEHKDNDLEELYKETTWRESIQSV